MDSFYCSTCKTQGNLVWRRRAQDTEAYWFIVLAGSVGGVSFTI